MTTFHIIHIIVGAWLLISNLFGMLSSTALMWNNAILGIVVALYNIYYLTVRNNVDVKSQ